MSIVPRRLFAVVDPARCASTAVPTLVDAMPALGARGAPTVRSVRGGERVL